MPESGRRKRGLGAGVSATPAAGAAPSSDRRVLPADCPTIPLGYHGHLLYVLDAKKQLHCLAAEDLRRTRLLNICDQAWLYRTYPRQSKAKDPDTGEDYWFTTGWHPEHFSEALENAVKDAGHFDIAERIRGRGAYRGEDGALVVHLGDSLWLNRGMRQLGQHGDHIYPAAVALPRPVKAEIGPDVGRALLAKIASNWQLGRGIDAMFLLGMLGIVVLGAALPVRPGCALTGERGTGKSELMLLLQAILGRWLVYSTDTTEAGLRQKLGRDALGALLDEAEATTNPEKFKRLQLYWRSSYGGGMTLRGGQNHTGAEFLALGTIMVAAINLPQMDPADRSRVIVIDFRPLPDGAAARPRLVHDALWPDVGQQLIRRLIDHYPRLIAETIPAWRQFLLDTGWDSRGADTYGVALACAWAQISDHAPTLEDFAMYESDLNALHEAHKAEEIPTWRQVFFRLWGWKVDFYRRGEMRPLGEQVVEGCGWGNQDPAQEDFPYQEHQFEAVNRVEKDAAFAAGKLDARKAMQQCRRYGINVITAPSDDERGCWRKGERLLAVAYSSPSLADVFQATPWAATPGGQGGWARALLRAPTATRWPYPLRFPFGCSRVVVMRLDVALAGMVGPDGPEMAETWQEAPAASAEAS
jgi:hypothetical protein